MGYVRQSSKPPGHGPFRFPFDYEGWKATMQSCSPPKDHLF
jgi:hypothetical protein